MSRFTSTMKLHTFAALGAALLITTAAQASQEQLAASIRDTQAETARTSEQLKATLAALNALTKQTKGDLRPAYNTFSAEVAKTELAAKMTATRSLWMSGDGRKYFAGWQKTIDGIANESLRKKAQKRLDTVKASYDKVEAQILKANDKFKPFLSDLGDIQKSLASDVTAGGVKTIRGVAKSASWNHQFVEQAISSALKEMDKMQKSLSAEAK